MNKLCPQILKEHVYITIMHSFATGCEGAFDIVSYRSVNELIYISLYMQLHGKIPPLEHIAYDMDDKVDFILSEL